MKQEKYTPIYIIVLICVILITASVMLVCWFFFDQFRHFRPMGVKPLPKSYSVDYCTLDTIVCPNEVQPKVLGNRVVTAYNPVRGQTDGDPCISASGVDICVGMAIGKHYIATNELPFGSIVQINGINYEVVDRTSSRYANRYDIAFPADQIKEAREWGKRVEQIMIEL